MNELAPAVSQPEEPIWSTCREESPSIGQTLTVFATYKDSRRDWETEFLAPDGAWVASEDEAALEEKLQRIIRLRNQSPPPDPKP
jgi:hypothetical protein